jgi:hypothetical protein
MAKVALDTAYGHTRLGGSAVLGPEIGFDESIADERWAKGSSE